MALIVSLGMPNTPSGNPVEPDIWGSLSPSTPAPSNPLPLPEGDATGLRLGHALLEPPASFRIRSSNDMSSLLLRCLPFWGRRWGHRGSGEEPPPSTSGDLSSRRSSICSKCARWPRTSRLSMSSNARSRPSLHSHVSPSSSQPLMSTSITVGNILPALVTLAATLSKMVLVDCLTVEAGCAR